MSLTPSVALEMTGISKRFGAVRALDDVRFAANTGTVHALLGENGAGKSTLMHIAFGLLRPDAGRVRLFGADSSGSVRDARRAGVGMVHQQLSLVPSFTAAENVALGGHGRFSPGGSARVLDDLATASGLRLPPAGVARDLSIVERQRLEILKALARGARLLILDEPTTGLAPPEIDELLRWIRAFADGGGTVVLVTHRLREALAVADAVTVLRRGVVVHAGPGRAGGATAETLARAIFPGAPDPAPVAPPHMGETVATLDAAACGGLPGRATLGPTTLRVRRGEIAGLAAVEGSGHRELLALLGGLLAPSTGRVELPPRIATIPSDRMRDALIADFDIVENVALRGAGTRRGRMPWRELSARAAGIIERFSIRAPDVSARARTLSGGNQQRLVIGRELAEAVDLVVADDPTRGLDIRASRFVHDQLRAAAAAGAGVVFYSSDLDEVLAIATRVLVVFHGTVTEVAAGRDAVGRAMLGAT